MKRTPLKRYTPLRSHTRLRSRARAPKSARVIAPEYLAWLHRQRCLIGSGCKGRITAHHVRILGSTKSDLHAVPLCEAHHLNGFGPDAIHTLGREGFETRFHLLLTDEIASLRARFEYETGRQAA